MLATLGQKEMFTFPKPAALGRTMYYLNASRLPLRKAKQLGGGGPKQAHPKKKHIIIVISVSSDNYMMV